MNNDLISRSAAIEIAMKYCPDDDGSCSKADIDLREMLDEFENIPDVEAEPVRHGKWLKGMMPTYGGWKCSLCEKAMVLPKPNFCPNCGAKMDAEVQE